MEHNGVPPQSAAQLIDHYQYQNQNQVTNENQDYSTAGSVRYESSLAGESHRPKLRWNKFSKSKIAQQIKDPLADLAKPSELSLQEDAKKKLRNHIEARNDGFLINQNPIIGDRYEHKLKLLQNNIDLA